MARGATRNQRPVDYSALGKKGRRTGAELPDTGQRDENGLEPIPSFSSPTKTDTPKTNGIPHDESTYNATYTADDTMEMESGTAPDPTDIIQNTRRQSVPRSSPIKKIPMSGTPKRPPGRPSTRPSLPSHTPIDKPGSLKRPKPGRPPKPTVKDKKKGPYDLSMSDDEQDAPQSDSIDPSLLDSNVQDEAPIDPEPAIDDSYDQQNKADEPPPDFKEQDTTIQSIEGADPPLDLPEVEQNEPDTTAGAISPPKPVKPKNKSGRPPKEQSLKPDDQKRPPGRPGKKAPSTDPPATTVLTAQKGPKRKQPFAERDPNINMKAQKKAPKQTASRADSAPPNSYLISRSHTPMMDEGAITTRSGRTVYKPLATWRGEKAVFAQRQDYSTPSAIQEIVRTEEMPPPPRPKARLVSRGKRSGRGRSHSVIAEEEEEEEEPLAQWEAEDGIQHAKVMAWDAEAGKYDEEYTEEVEIGFAANAMQLRDIQSATFQFAKTLTLPFFGSGMVGIPPGGEKRVKNSRKMQMVFFVFYGRVTVNVGTPTTTFSIGKGGQWQVPRGNFYSIINESETHDARLFFAQGCQWNGEDDMGNSAE